jgi:iron complex transport system substrate-binding protein
MTRGFISITCLVLVLSCQSPEKNTTPSDPSYREIKLSNASAFSIQKKGQSFRVRTFHPEHPDQLIQEIIVGEDSDQSTNSLQFTKPISRVAILSTTYLEYIRSLHEASSISCASNVDLIYSPEIRERIAKGQIVDLGNEDSFNMERLIDAKVDLVFYYDFGPGTSAMISRLENMDIRVVRVFEYLEKDPLGKAEWIKFFGALYNKMDEAERIFDTIRDEYIKLKALTNKKNAGKTVFTGLPWKGEWHQPGGASFQASYFRDAGADYLWKQDSSVSGILMDREVIFDKALDADIWIHPNNAIKLNDIFLSDKRFEQFKSFRNGEVYNNNKRINDHMGNDYWESGLLHPHLILKDLISIFQPEILPDHELYYYQKLE